LPFKFEAFALAARRTPRAELAQAANTLRFDGEADGGWLADNTDGVGLVRDITVNAGVPLAGQRVLLLGAGGASAGVLGPLIEARPSEVVLANRTVDKAEAIVARHRQWAADMVWCCAPLGSMRPAKHSTCSSMARPPAWQVAACPWARKPCAPAAWRWT